MSNYDNFINSFRTFFEISTLEWTGIMFKAMDTVGYDQGPQQDNNKYV